MGRRGGGVQNTNLLLPRSQSSEVCVCANQIPPLVPHIIFRFRLQWPVFDRLQVSSQTPCFADSVIRAFDRRFNLSRSVQPGEPWQRFLIAVFPVCFEPVFSHCSVQGTQHWQQCVYFRIGFSPCVSHFDDMQQLPFNQSALLWMTFHDPAVVLRQLGSQASIFSEWFLQPGASQSSPRQFHLDDIRSVSQATFQLWLFAEAMFQGRIQVQPKPLSSQNHFHPKPLSSPNNFIQNNFIQNNFIQNNFIQNQFHPKNDFDERTTANKS